MSKRVALALGFALCVSALAVAQDEARPVVRSEDGRTVLSLGGRDFHATDAAISGLRAIEVPRSKLRLFLWDERAGAASSSWFAISPDGASVARVRRAAHEIGVEHGAFDPLRGEPAVAPRLAASAGSDLWLVQLEVQPLAELRAGLEAAGARILAYVPSHAYAVRASAEARERVAALPYVRWVGRYHPAYRLERVLRESLDSEALRPERAYNVLCFERAAKAPVAARIEALGGRIEKADAGARLIQAALSPEELVLVAGLDEVEFVDRWSPPQADMDLAREISGGNYFHDTLGLRGDGVRGEVLDVGIRQTHLDFNPPPLIHGGPPGIDPHGTSTYGIVFGDGSVCLEGSLPDAIGIAADSSSMLVSRYLHTGELVNPSLPYQAVFQTNSWGSFQVTTYTTESADLDEALFDHDILIFQSQSNLGTQSSRPQAWCKNILSVGGIRHFNTLSTADDSWSGGASIGPAADGRIKPDLAHHYDSISTTDGGANNDCRPDFCCTSAATPVTAGHGGLFFQLWHMGAFGNVPGATVFESRPHMTLAKAILIANAEQWPFAGANQDLGRMHQGFGRIDIHNVYDNRLKTIWVDETEVLPELGVSTRVLTIQPGTTELRVVLTWADPPGNPGVQTQHRVNDLDLKLTNPNNKILWGNFGLDTQMVSATNGTANTKDTVECVFVDDPLPGTWTLEVIASEINQDGHVETPALDQDFALVAIGFDLTELVVPLCPGDGSSAACPCGNSGAPGHGCENSGATGGVLLGAANHLPDHAGGGTVDLEGTGFPPTGAPTVLAIRSTLPAPSGIGLPFGDGLLCLGAPVLRIASTTSTGGSATISLNHGAGAGFFTYQLWYRNTAPFCTASAFNLSNALRIAWP